MLITKSNFNGERSAFCKRLKCYWGISDSQIDAFNRELNYFVIAFNAPSANLNL